ncbi:nicotinate-nucleotide adenylyltransferase [soil metagenome]
MLGFPRAEPGLRVGLLGGSFDPPHAGHLHVTRRALAAFGLDRVWWLVSPGNPLKPRGPAEMERRLAAAQRLVAHPQVVVSDLEARLGTRYTAATLARLLPRYPGVRFVWLMGADNLAGFHRWERSDAIFAALPIGVLARPGEQVRAGLSPAAMRYRRARLPAAAARLLPRLRTPAWTLLTGPMVGSSSTALRVRGLWPG